MVKRVLKRLLTPGDRLSQRVVHAGFWAFALRITDRLFELARTIVLARVLSPNDFGLFGIALLGLSALNTFSQTGFQAALVQKKGDIKPYLDTAWTVQVIRGFVLAGILFGIAPYVASFFGEPMAAPLLRVLGLSAVFQGLTNIGVVYFQKELEFHKRFIYMFSGTLADLGVAIPAALILRNAWALVLGLLAGNFVRMAVSYLIHPYRPKVWLDSPKVKELSTFGKWILGSSAIIFLATQGDDIFLGKILGATALGLYQMAFRFSNLVATEITHVTSQVTFSVYSKLQDKPPKLREAFLQTVDVVMSLSLPLAGGILVLASDFVWLFLGKAWVQIIPALQILTISGLIRSITATSGPLYKAIGRPNIGFWTNVVRLGTMAIAIYPLTKSYNMNGTALAVVIGIASAIPIWLTMSLRILNIGMSALTKRLAPSLVGTCVMILFILLTRWVLSPLTIYDFTVILFIAAVSYLVCQFVFHKWRARNSPGQNSWQSIIYRS